ncbi:MAG TPA: zinc-dependent alcohol dehydrogenase family protein [Dehalococcoidia bacterium]|jgi:propanol-preferring alcohol dehydrogenase
MRAMLLTHSAPIGSAPLALADVPDPTPGPGELLLRVSACAVCRTDLQLCEGDLPLHRSPLVPGHQAVGVVEAVGEDASGWRAGDVAGIGWLGGACGACDYCRGGRENLCAAARFTGWDRDGGFAERITVRADFALRLPQGFDALDAAPLLCGGVIGYRALKRSAIETGGSLGLFGFGASASLAIQVAVHWGCRVYVWTRSEREQQRALNLGAVWAGTYDASPGIRMDAAVTFAPSGDVIVAALRAVAPGGTVAINAIHLDRIPEFDYDLLWRERGLVSVANYTRRDAHDFLELAAAVPVRTKTETFGFPEANRALALLSRGQLTATAVLAP